MDTPLILNGITFVLAFTTAYFLEKRRNLVAILFAIAGLLTASYISLRNGDLVSLVLSLSMFVVLTVIGKMLFEKVQKK